mmetsp:Transcript_6042/g.18150  ORF Transcript_6042/g.18150 Transcript_6042/m.18150 type:complete len:366 (+) Transcript_6042:74-1171(+)
MDGRWREAGGGGAGQRDGPTVDNFLAATELSALGTQLPPAHDGPHRSRRRSTSPLPPLSVGKGVLGRRGPAITYKDRFRAGVEQRRMIASKADDRWVGRLLGEAAAAVDNLPPTSVAPGAVDARRLAIFTDAFDVFISRQPAHLAAVFGSIKSEYDGYIRGPKPPRLDPLGGGGGGAAGGPAEASTPGELRGHIGCLQRRAHALRAAAAAAERDRATHDSANANIDPPFAAPRPEAAAGRSDGGRRARSPHPSDGHAAVDGFVAGTGPIPAMVAEMAAAQADISRLEAEQARCGVPTEVVGWLESNLHDVEREIRLVRRQIDILTASWFAAGLAALGLPAGVHSYGEDFAQTTTFGAPPEDPEPV